MYANRNGRSRPPGYHSTALRPDASSGWRDRLVGRDAIEASAAWYRGWRHGDDMRAATLAEIDRYPAGAAADA